MSLSIVENILAINKSESRRGNSIDGVILHSMAGFYKGTLAWFNRPDVPASAHYLVSKTGEISKCVEEERASWHAGEVSVLYEEAPEIMKRKWGINPNLYTIGIELEDENNKEWVYPQKQYFATVELVADIFKRHKITPSLDTILMHKQTNPLHRTDPIGNWHHEQFVNDVIEVMKVGNIEGTNAPMYRYVTTVVPSLWTKALVFRSGPSQAFDKVQVKNWLGKKVDKLAYAGKSKIKVKGFVKGQRVEYMTPKGMVGTQFWWVTEDDEYIWSGGTSYLNNNPVIITLKDFPDKMREQEKSY